MLALQIRMLRKHRVPADEPPHLRVIVACPDAEHTRITVIVVDREYYT